MKVTVEKIDDMGGIKGYPGIRITFGDGKSAKSVSFETTAAQIENVADIAKIAEKADKFRVQFEVR